ncbi:MAG: NERD domain-containing protein [Anaerolineales bacterium]|nr:NERD domain-containing protein [Anaerolineales bacterium]MCL4260177.1 NERD domain-containing protein [Anaerolineales bacterium]
MKSKPEKRSPLKDKPLRYAGQSLDEQIEEKAFDLLYWFLVPVITTILVIGDWVRFINPRPAQQPIVVTVAALILLVIGAFKFFRGKREIGRLKMARDGEKLVAEGLQEMIKQGATVLNDIQGDKFNIDHVVVSKNGIFLIETKTYSKPIKKDAKITFTNEKVFADGKLIDRTPIDQAKALAKWLQELLIQSCGTKFNIRPVVLFPGWFIEPMKRGQEVWILNPKALPTFISNEPATLKDTDVHLIAFHLSRYVRTFISKEGK